ncbi:cytochrome c2 iso-2 domain protein [Paraburkholderia xenovorans LB400]|uniref:Cytochrome c n=1 Tax=Paraburkholderia xenovorans (strain LB400) TaxID=266265 RepID=Q13IC5_PARXL|nr:c-type cytochrome [Paraburkholderia xenovorans]ABE36164.1 Putative cytochrome c [Paraburkholderia xenovorans LB400]AIP34956.1 cytochrome c2 iso-2 domain protein [Paraburkholderia xenovorans LB400]
MSYYGCARVILRIGCCGALGFGWGMASADSVAPAQAFERCAACHGVAQGDQRVGPSLGDVLGRQAGSMEGFRYSSAMRSSGIVWTAQSLELFLKDPQRAVPGNRMAFSGVDDAPTRDAIVDYLREHSQAR